MSWGLQPFNLFIKSEGLFVVPLYGFNVYGKLGPNVHFAPHKIVKLFNKSATLRLFHNIMITLQNHSVQ